MLVEHTACARRGLELPFSVNYLGQMLHLNGFTPVCVRSSQVTLLFMLNRLGQTEHRNGFSPVWVRSWVFKIYLL